VLRAATAWLLGSFIGWGIFLLDSAWSRSTAGDRFPFDILAGNLLVALFIVWRWRDTLALSRFRPNAADLAVALPVGYAMANIAVLLVGLPEFDRDWLFTNPYRALTVFCAVLLVPATEEILYRGTILAILLGRLHLVVAVAITTLAWASMHEGWLRAAIAGLLLCLVYLIRGRSVAAAFLAHAFANAFLLMPKLLLIIVLAKK
jgi:membrane protease YdiL (CAAX protease family)